jgi:hypothetical protein
MISSDPGWTASVLVIVELGPMLVNMEHALVIVRPFLPLSMQTLASKVKLSEGLRQH